MNICVFGAGAVGGHIAGRLSASEAEVSVIARGRTLEAIRERGLHVQLREGELVSHPIVTGDVDDLPPQDVVIVAVKSPSLPGIAEQIGRLLAPDGMALFVLNGIPWWYLEPHGSPLDGVRLEQLDPDGMLRGSVGADHVIGGVAYTACSVIEPGVIHAENPRNRLIIGRPDGRVDARVDQLQSMLAAGGLEATATSRIRDAVWQKLAMNLVGGSLSVLSGSPMGRVLNLPGVMHTAEEMAAEAASIARALGCDPGDTEQGLRKLAASAHLQSIAQDLVAGRQMEIDTLLRIPLELARLVDVATPRLSLLVELATERARAAGCYLR